MDAVSMTALSVSFRMSHDRTYEERLDHAASALRLASGFTTKLLANVINGACTRIPVLAKAGKTARIRQLIEAGAQVDAMLALIELELPRWRLRRLALDDGQWHCSLSRQPNLPIGLDDTADGRHEHIVLAILTAFVEALRMARVTRKSAVPAVTIRPADGYRICCDNFL
jgi:hypothetical protein